VLTAGRWLELIAALLQGKHRASEGESDDCHGPPLEDVTRLADKAQLPVAVASTAKAVIDESFPYYLGLYDGKGGQRVRPGIPADDRPAQHAWRHFDRRPVIVVDEPH
jgi:hypothetical protein